MSAFVVSKAHIDAMVQAGLRAAAPARGGYTLRWRAGVATIGELTRETADAVGSMLWDENFRSVSDRYHEPQIHGGYRLAPSKVTDPVAILKAIHCYEYQACEHPGWETSEAAAFCVALEKAMIRMLPGYDAAPWGIQ